jgi:hypothetical protein
MIHHTHTWPRDTPSVPLSTTPTFVCICRKWSDKFVVISSKFKMLSTGYSYSTVQPQAAGHRGISCQLRIAARHIALGHCCICKSNSSANYLQKYIITAWHHDYYNRLHSHLYPYLILKFICLQMHLHKLWDQPWDLQRTTDYLSLFNLRKPLKPVRLFAALVCKSQCVKNIYTLGLW